MLTSVNATATVYAGGLKATNTALQNRDALQAALDTGQNVHIPRGTYRLTGPLLFRAQGQFVFGQGAFQTILRCSGSQNIFESNGRASVGVRDLMFRGGADIAGGYAIYLDGTPTHGATGIQVWGGVVENVFMDQMWSGVFVRDVNTVTMFNLSMQAMRGFHGVRAEALTTNHRIDTVRLTHCIYNAHPDAVAAGRGDGVSIDGCVHTIIIYNTAIVGAWRGVVIDNTPGFPFGQHAAFLFCDDLEVDFPQREALTVGAIDRLRCVNTYLHGSKSEANVLLGTNVRDAKFANCNITGAWKTGLFFDGDILDVTATEFDWNGQEVVGVHHGILLGHSARDVRIVGGGGDGARVAYGICRINPETAVQLAAADAHRGVFGSRNF